MLDTGQGCRRSCRLEQQVESGGGGAGGEGNSTGVSTLSPLSRTCKCYQCREAGELLPWALHTIPVAFASRGALWTRREWATGVELPRAANGGRQMRLFFQKRGRLEVGFWGGGSQGAREEALFLGCGIRPGLGDPPGQSSGSSGNEHHLPVSG